MGLWIIQSLQKEIKVIFERMVVLAKTSNYQEIFDVNDSMFLAPESMKQAILKWFDDHCIAGPKTDADLVNSFTGLENGENLEYVVASEPMITSQAYSLVLVKVKDGVSADEVAKTMSENVNQRKWICVTAEKLYATSSGDIACLVMSNEEMAKPVYEKFKTLAGNVNEEYQKTAEEPELPEDMY
jgi:hypothetical protein